MLRLFPLLLAFTAGVTPLPPAPVRVVTSLTTYATIAREITGDRGIVSSIATGDENPHYVQRGHPQLEVEPRRDEQIRLRQRRHEAGLGLHVVRVLIARRDRGDDATGAGDFARDRRLGG